MAKTKKSLKVPKNRGLYAFTKYRRGDFLLFLKEGQDNVLEFMHLPDRYKIFLTKEEFTQGAITGLLDFIEQIPEEVFEVAAANVENFEKKS